MCPRAAIAYDLQEIGNLGLKMDCRKTNAPVRIGNRV
jgi:hypothetical protein